LTTDGARDARTPVAAAAQDASRTGFQQEQDFVQDRGVADPSGSINTTSVGKTNFWSFVAPLFGAALATDTGLLNHNMPGPANTPQSMVFDPALEWFIAEGIPITPYDDAGAKNYYRLMEVSAVNAE
jgi:hypothetical protein